MWIFSNILLLSSISADINDEFDAHACGRKMLPYRQPARGAAARSASLEDLSVCTQAGYSDRRKKDGNEICCSGGMRSYEQTQQKCVISFFVSGRQILERYKNGRFSYNRWRADGAFPSCPELCADNSEQQQTNDNHPGRNRRPRVFSDQYVQRNP